MLAANNLAHVEPVLVRAVREGDQRHAESPYPQGHESQPERESIQILIRVDAVEDLSCLCRQDKIRNTKWFMTFNYGVSQTVGLSPSCRPRVCANNCCSESSNSWQRQRVKIANQMELLGATTAHMLSWCVAQKQAMLGF